MKFLFILVMLSAIPLAYASPLDEKQIPPTYAFQIINGTGGNVTATSWKDFLTLEEGTGITISFDYTLHKITFDATGFSIDPVTCAANNFFNEWNGTHFICDVGSGSNEPSLSTGVLTGGVLSTGAGSNQYSISNGTGVIVEPDGTKTFVSWSGKTNIVPTNLATNLLTWVSIDENGNVLEKTSKFTTKECRDQICLGVIVHVDKTTVDNVNNEQLVAYNVRSQLNDLASAMGFFNIEGNVFSANGANLQIDKSVGKIFAQGSNYNIDSSDPNIKTLGALSPVTFQYRFSNGNNGVTGTNIDPNNLDNGSGGDTSVGVNKWSIQRIYSFVSNNVKIQKGTAQYGTAEAAIASIANELSYITEPSILQNGVLRGWLIVKQGATSLNGADAVFIEAGKFGDRSGAGGGGGGEANTASSVGTGEGTLTKAKVGVDLPFKSLKQATGIIITNNTDDVTFATSFFANSKTCTGDDKISAYNNMTGEYTCTADIDTGQSNTASNLGTVGEGLFTTKTGVDLPFKKLVAGDNITLNANGTRIMINATGGGGDNLGNHIATQDLILGSNNLNTTNHSLVPSSGGINMYDINSDSTQFNLFAQDNVYPYTQVFMQTTNSSDKGSYFYTSLGGGDGYIGSGSINGGNTARIQIWAGDSFNNAIFNTDGSTTFNYSIDMTNDKITNLGAPTVSTDAARANTLQTKALATGTCSNDQVLAYQNSNSTWICKTVTGSGDNLGNHIATQDLILGTNNLNFTSAYLYEDSNDLVTLHNGLTSFIDYFVQTDDLEGSATIKTVTGDPSGLNDSIGLGMITNNGSASIFTDATGFLTPPPLDIYVDGINNARFETNGTTSFNYDIDIDGNKLKTTSFEYYQSSNTLQNEYVGSPSTTKFYFVNPDITKFSTLDLFHGSGANYEAIYMEIDPGIAYIGSYKGGTGTAPPIEIWAGNSFSNMRFNTDGSTDVNYELDMTNDKITNLGTPTVSTDAARANTLQTKALATGTCSNDQVLAYQNSNSTWICKTVTGSGDNLGNHIATQDLILGSNKLNFTDFTISENGNQILVDNTNAAFTSFSVRTPGTTGGLLEVVQGDATNYEAIYMEVGSGSGTAYIGSYAGGTGTAAPIEIWAGNTNRNLIFKTDGTTDFRNNILMSANRITDLGSPIVSTDAARANTLQTKALATGTCSNNQVLKYQSSNSTWVCGTDSGGSPRGGFLVASWDSSSTKTNIGTSFVDVYTGADSNGKAQFIDTDAFTQVRLQIEWNKVGGGTQSCQIVDIASGTDILITLTVVDGSNDSGFVAIPSSSPNLLNVEKNYKIQCKSTTAADDPVFESAAIWLK